MNLWIPKNGQTISENENLDLRRFLDTLESKPKPFNVKLVDHPDNLANSLVQIRSSDLDQLLP